MRRNPSPSKRSKEKTMSVRLLNWTKLVFLVILPVFAATGCGGQLAAPTPADLVTAFPVGLASECPDDQDISGDPDIIFADNFELWDRQGTLPPLGTWDVSSTQTSRRQVIPGNVTVNGSSGPGERVLEVACWTEDGGSQVGGLTLKLGNYKRKDEGLGDGCDDLFVRYYINTGSTVF
jgi:hypothetical protein